MCRTNQRARPTWQWSAWRMPTQWVTMDDTPFEETSPIRSRWDQEGAEFVRTSADWCARCTARLLELQPQLSAAAALDLAQETSLQDNLRALSPERVAEEVLNGPHLSV